MVWAATALPATSVTPEMVRVISVEAGSGASGVICTLALLLLKLMDAGTEVMPPPLIETVVPVTVRGSIGPLKTTAMFAFNGLPNLRRKAFDPSLTNNRFAIVIENPPTEGMDEQSKAKGFKAFSESEAAQFLKQLGASEVRSVYSEGWF